jgi:UDP-N-acetylmuramyl pentapeptide phosphotransferase/UDP-N-acetylglucosamine-1-phosphate transferase
MKKGDSLMIKTHRVGTITLGGMLVSFGALFLLRIFLNDLSYDIIFGLWPIIFIFLGLEILIANFRQKEGKLIYDKTAFALIIILSFFAMGMAITELCLEYASNQISVRW